MCALTNVMRDYPWGSSTAIAELLGKEPSGGPEAELWMGAHPDSPSIAATPDGPVPLDRLIAEHPESTLGSGVHAAFGAKLPFEASEQVLPTANEQKWFKSHRYGHDDD